MDITEFLHKEGNHCVLPAWLESWAEDSSFDINHFLSSDVVFYPGGATDGQPIKLFNIGCHVSCFLYADSDPKILETVNQEFSKRPLKGYDLFQIREIRFAEVFRESSGTTIVSFNGGDGIEYNARDDIGCLYIFKKKDCEIKDIGSQFVAILYLHVDAFYVYETLFSEKNPPLAVLLADHGFGNNYAKFGGGDKLEDISIKHRILPKWLLVAENTCEWKHYQRLQGVNAAIGGMNSQKRYLFGI